MEANLHNIYLLRAIEAYPYELEKAVEALNYALAYDPNSVMALCLMARVYDEQLGDKATAKTYYERAMASNMDIPAIYPDFIRLLINNGDFEEAQKLIDFAMTIKGIDKAGILLNQAYLFEAQKDFKRAAEVLQDAKLFALNNDFIYFADEVIKRVDKKAKMQNNKNRKDEAVTKKEAEKPKVNWFQNRLNNLL
ncbi:tetratricopeptide repeat protein [Hyunsoonleella sp. SJ7]|uniref:Tetratricopeptide repeat protein n=1 Tax=Hyunsoonleella aquatilis TaxID=2762758 RepID=A0A923HGE8_9FLAO|nr:tetratricopeptide repeat protein [Hyunsoonleella aquatilis]MBC3759808.1 tetratricopeptide repeat protein [Hyunsoonleella aquatilis]